ncbi:hypothetical protein V1477_020773 [Vespula maculifrons]|uniref:Uncharacterized protein n=2 Tax=Vespula TaxID=7451 RepID=A0A834KAY8_VESVU|nr:hypothetical protein HZH66_004698 [Vespula vulgaris]
MSSKVGSTSTQEDSQRKSRVERLMENLERDRAFPEGRSLFPHESNVALLLLLMMMMVGVCGVGADASSAIGGGKWLQQVQGLTKVSVSLVTWSLALPLSRMKLLEDDEITALLYLTFVIRDSRR